MAKTKISEFSSTPGNNTDIDGINIAEGCAPSGINNAIRELMSQLKDFQAGTAGDSFNGPVGTTTAAAGAFTTLTTSSTVTHNAGTANGVAYLNGSKVLTTGSALTFDGTNLGLGTASPNNNSGYGGLTINGTTGGIIDIKAAGSDVMRIFGTATQSMVRTTTATPLLLGTNDLERMRIDSAGNVGIGTSSPGSFAGKLVVNGGHSILDGNQLFLWSSGNGFAPSIYAPGDSIAFRDNNGSERMRLTSTGLGIGTSSPAYRLDVVGNIGVTAGNGLICSAATQSYITLASGTSEIGYQGTLNFRAFNGGSPISAMQLSSSGNLGLGVTPSAWGSSNALQVGSWASLSSANAYGTGIGFNNFYNGTNHIYSFSNAATKLELGAGVFKFFTAPSGTAGNAISFTQAMTLDASGNLIVGGSTWYGRITSTNGALALVTNTASQRRLSFWSTANGDSENAYIQVQNDGATTNTGEMLFATKNSGGTLAERARIDSSGNLLIGATSGNSSNATTRLQVTYSSNTGPGLLIADTTIQNNSTFASFVAGTTRIGSVTANGTTAVAYNTSSDYRLKHDIQPMTGALAKVALLKPVTYKWNADDSAGEGFIAHELAEVCPDAVSGEKDAVDAEGNPVYQGIDTSFLVATLTAAIQEQQAIITALTARVAALESN